MHCPAQPRMLSGHGNRGLLKFIRTVKSPEMSARVAKIVVSLCTVQLATEATAPSPYRVSLNKVAARNESTFTRAETETDRRAGGESRLQPGLAAPQDHRGARRRR